MSKLFIPLHRTDEHVEITVDQLASTEPKDLIHLFVEQRVPLEIWLRVAVRPSFAFTNALIATVAFLNMVATFS